MLEIKNNVTVCTVAELAAYLAESIDAESPVHSHFCECDFALDYPGEDTDDIEFVTENAVGWYGVKRVPGIGFDSDCLIMAVDCYGGGSFTVSQFLPGCINTVNIKDAILDTILSSVNMSGCLESDSEILVQFQ